MLNIQVFQLSIEELSTIIKEAVASEFNVSLNQKTLKNDDSNELLTREEVSKMLKVSNTTLFNWNNEGILKNYKVGRRVYYKREDVINLGNPLKAVS